MWRPQNQIEYWRQKNTNRNLLKTLESNQTKIKIIQPSDPTLLCSRIETSANKVQQTIDLGYRDGYEFANKIMIK